MLTLNQKPSESVGILATIDPASQAAGTAATGWVDISVWFGLMALIDVGAFGASATVDANLQQATDSSGTGAKAIANKAITQMVAAGGNNKQAILQVRPQELDTEGGFRYVKLNLIVGTAATQTQATVLGFGPRFQPANTFNQAGVVQVVG